MAAAGTTVNALNTAGGVAATTGPKSASGHFFTRWGDASTLRIFCANSADIVFAFDPAVPSFSIPVWSGVNPQGNFLAVQPQDNRLVSAAFPTNRSRVHFSDAGDAYTFGANNYVDVTPGDGEEIKNIISWRDLLFVFKGSRFFVFYGNSTDGTGEPVFNFRTVDTGIGLLASKAICAAHDGIYFLGQRGVYKTTGGDPVLVSGVIDPYFRGEAQPPAFLSSIADPTYISVTSAMCAHQDRIYLAVPTTGATQNSNLLVYDTRQGWWSLWDLQAAAMASWGSTLGREELYFANLAAAVCSVRRVTYTATQDVGVAIDGRYRTGFWNAGEAGREAIVREWLFDGTGTLEVHTATNDSAIFGPVFNASVPLGVSPAVAQGRDRNAVKGRNVSLGWSSLFPWSVSRITANVRGQSAAGAKSS
jgi:hypothetical protein